MELFLSVVLNSLKEAHSDDLENQTSDIGFTDTYLFESAVDLVVSCLSMLQLADVVSCDLSCSLADLWVQFGSLLSEEDETSFDEFGEVLEERGISGLLLD